MWMWVTMALAAVPEVAVTWSHDQAVLTVEAPDGHEIAPEAPGRLALEVAEMAIEVAGDGAVLASLPMPDVRGQTIGGRLEATVCSKADGSCVPMRMDFAGTVPEGRRGRMALAVSPVDTGPSTAAGSPFQADAAAAAEAAFEAARATERGVLLDFSAVWCPPCNLLAAEVLHATPPPEGLEDWLVVVLDVDDPSSFVLKDRYAIGSYPTVVAADASGRELSRVVGYPGREAFMDWLALADAPAAEPETLSPQQAAAVAWQKVQRGEDAAAWLVRAEQGEPTPELRKARLQEAPSVEDARWLAANERGTAAQWLYPALSLVEETPDLAPALLSVVHEDLPRASGQESSDLLYFAGRLSDEGTPWYAAAAAALRTTFTGEPEHDRGHYTWLASLMAMGGDVDGALAFLDEQASRWPDEPTWQLTGARLLLEAERLEDALALTAVGLERSWGDNRLRMATLRAQALVALDRHEDAAVLARETLAAASDATELDVRTHRYRKKLAAFAE